MNLARAIIAHMKENKVIADIFDIQEDSRINSGCPQVIESLWNELSLDKPFESCGNKKVEAIKLMLTDRLLAPYGSAIRTVSWNN